MDDATDNTIRNVTTNVTFNATDLATGAITGFDTYIAILDATYDTIRAVTYTTIYYPSVHHNATGNIISSVIDDLLREMK